MSVLWFINQRVWISMVFSSRSWYTHVPMYCRGPPPPPPGGGGGVGLVCVGGSISGAPPSVPINLPHLLYMLLTYLLFTYAKAQPDNVIFRVNNVGHACITHTLSQVLYVHHSLPLVLIKYLFYNNVYFMPMSIPSCSLWDNKLYGLN